MTSIEPIAVPIPEACRMVGLGRSHLYEEIAAGKIEARKSGKRTVILVESLRAYVADLPRLNKRLGKATPAEA